MPLETMDFGPLRVVHDASVLTPRPWTLAQSEWARRLLDELPSGSVLELCAGVGHIGLAAVHGTGRALVLVDRDEHACELARVNAEGADHPVEVRHGTAATVMADDERFALVIADPPWVPSAGTGQFREDPVWAIDGGPDGLDIARECVDVIGRHLLPDGHALLQLGTSEQADALELDLDSADLAICRRAAFDRGVLVLIERRNISD
ncbi:methyltransferase [Aeromicrobium sp. CF4.19]|uniref:methyltransferase n=1 Tax=Aeromicrobium sp. CF4.19 TaxID=3373082 RepID=UPI003EE81593